MNCWFSVENGNKGKSFRSLSEGRRFPVTEGIGS